MIFLRPSLSAVLGFIFVVFITLTPMLVIALFDSLTPATKVGSISFKALSKTNQSELLK